MPENAMPPVIPVQPPQPSVANTSSAEPSASAGTADSAGGVQVAMITASPVAVDAWLWRSPLWLALAAAVILYWFMPVLTPFLVAAAFAYLSAPLVERLCRWHWPRALAVALVLLLLVLAVVALLLLVIPLLQKEAALVTARAPLAWAWLSTELLPRLSAWGITLPELDELQAMLSAQLPQAKSAILTVLAYIGSSGLGLLGVLAKTLLLPVILFYLLMDWPLLKTRLAQLLPPRFQEQVLPLGRECDAVLAAFVRGQISVMLVLAVYYSLALWAAGLDVALLVGLMTGLLCFIPYLGFGLGLLLGCIAVLLQTGDISALLGVLVAFAGGQLLEGLVLQPLLLGNRIGLHPVAVLFAVLAGGELFGFTGVLLALPVAAVVVVLLRHGRSRYLASTFYGRPD